MVYAPKESRDNAGRSAFARVLETFFSGSLEEALTAHLMARKDGVTSVERDRLVKLIKQTEREGR